ncbi:hypothetical protein H696_01195 [Fonticula alba]|uniref:2-amino-4-hydroxy-6-hydroxymethyldihydropteridine diphosphokinase n=1 Tax=Fonticula alba TaxID=691883 RepID=A0A058ZE91_FONAL|nr:hypothetical protein H696_01195 [Fonticula alba]KCV71777.1 hypothetical protein H696_01195 [Fonticula alba]|eukprot:XP_009493355.1 hypothetical protein H696_01195 [Fonticula alba]
MSPSAVASPDRVTVSRLRPDGPVLCMANPWDQAAIGSLLRVSFALDVDLRPLHGAPGHLLDDHSLARSVDYSAASEQVRAHLRTESFGSPIELAIGVAELLLGAHGRIVGGPASRAEVTLHVERPFLLADMLEVRCVMALPADGGPAVVQSLSARVCDVRVAAVIGLREYERHAPQPILLSFDLHLAPVAGGSACGGASADVSRLGDLCAAAVATMAASSFGTLEALVTVVIGQLEERIRATSGRVSLGQSAPLQAETLTVDIGKPIALPAADCAAVSATRRLDRPARSLGAALSDASPAPSEEVVCFLAIGGNIGDRSQFLFEAVRALRRIDGVRLLDTSFLYETPPAYVTDQPAFLNAALKIATTLTPRALLRACKAIEVALGRPAPCGSIVAAESPVEIDVAIDRGALDGLVYVRNGPRPIDLDILFYGDATVRLEAEALSKGAPPGPAADDALARASALGGGFLTIPHAGIPEREFVLRPLMDIAPDFVHPVNGLTVAEMLAQLPARDFPPRVYSFGRGGQLVPHGAHTLTVGILNLTPDSFSTAPGEHLVASAGTGLDLDRVEGLARSMLDQGAHILDLGSQSTRPGAVEIPADVEAERLLSSCVRLRQAGIRAPLSLDTYRPAVAERVVRGVWAFEREAFDAGGILINDVSGGAGGLALPGEEAAPRDPGGMLRLCANLNIPIVLMHVRGDTATMTSAEMKDYSAQGGVVRGVASELASRVRAAIEAGVPRWNILVDPGLGFAKTPADSLRLIRQVADLPAGLEHDLRGMPVFAGPSRKGFLASVVPREPHERVLLTAAACSSLVGALLGRFAADRAGDARYDADRPLLLRVHDVAECAEATRLSDAIWRSAN